MKKVFLEDLPRRGKYIDWKKSVGHKVQFIYDDVEGEITILNYNNYYLKLKYNDNEHQLSTGNFLYCKIEVLIGKRSSEYKYYVGEVVEGVAHGRLKILENIRIITKYNKLKGYVYKCLDCDNDDTIRETHLHHGVGCNVCSGRKVLRGNNDMWTTNPEIARLLWNPEDGYKLPVSSSLRIDFRCPCCGDRIKSKHAYNVMRQCLSCPRCSDGVSYPNRFMYNVMTQANLNFECEYSPEWAIVTGHENEKLNGRKRYDFRSHQVKFTIEMQGIQHYKEVNRGGNSRTLAEEQENDNLKEELHMYHEKGEYIKIKADISSPEYLKQNILNSKLTKYIDFNNFDWQRCDEDSQKSLVKIACDHYNAKNKNTSEIAKIMGLARGTIRRYLKRGAEIGWCGYDPKEEVIKRVKRLAVRKKESKLSNCL